VPGCYSADLRDCHSNGRACYDKKIAESKTPKEALRSLKRQVSDAIYSRLQADARRGSQDQGPGRATGERLCRQRGRIAPRAPALRPSHPRARHHPATPERTLTDPSGTSAEENPERLLMR
jgi:hypothetical protein